MSSASPKSALPRPQERPTGRFSSSTVVLGMILACQLMIVLDISIIISALPKIHHALGFSSTGLSWVQNAYTLTFGGLLLLGARAGDILGRRRMFIVGIGIFTLASLAGGLAESPGWLLSARAAQGIGAAIAAPSTLALLMMTFREGTERTRALAGYSAVSAAGGSVGLVLGGMLTSWVSWRFGLFINVPIGLLLMWLAPRFLPETERHTGRFDLSGAATSTLGMTSLVYGFVRAASDGWSNTITISSFVASAVLLAAFVLIERRAEQPITPLRLFANRERSGAYIARVMVTSGIFSTFFFLTQFMQGVRHLSALQAGLAFLPMTILMFAFGRLVPRLSTWIANTQLLIGGLLVALVGIVWLTQISEGTDYFPQIAVPLALMGIGMGVAFAPLTSAGLMGVEPRDAGAASGLLNAAQQLGGSLGLGILVTVFASANRSTHGDAAQHLSHAVTASLIGSAVFIALALLVAIVLMRSPAVAHTRPEAAVAEPAEEEPARLPQLAPAAHRREVATIAAAADVVDAA